MYSQYNEDPIYWTKYLAPAIKEGIVIQPPIKVDGIATGYFVNS